MKSIRARIAVAIAGGLLSSIVIAWVAVIFVNPHTGGAHTIEMRHRGDSVWRIECTEQAVKSSVIVTRHSVDLPEAGDMSVTDAVPKWVAKELELIQPGTPPDGFIAQASGWPLLCLRATQLLTAGSNGAVSTGTSWGIPISGQSSSAAPGTVIPLRPLWGGLLGDTLVYAVAWFAVLSAIVSTRRILLVRRGKCLDCGYSLVGLNGHRCPECGANIARPQQRA